jgi:hypothetical protein
MVSLRRAASARHQIIGLQAKMDTLLSYFSEARRQGRRVDAGSLLTEIVYLCDLRFPKSLASVYEGPVCASEAGAARP